MSKFTNWDAYDKADELTHTLGGSSIDVGAYPIKIVAVEDVPEKEYIIVKFDIASGDNKGMYGRFVKNDIQNWPLDAQNIRSYKETAMAFFKAFITAVEKSNEGYSFKNSGGDFKSLVGKYAVGVFLNKEIPVPDEDNDLKPKVRVKFHEWRSGPALREGRIEIDEKIIKLDDYNKEKYEDALKEYKKPVQSHGTQASVETPTYFDDDDLPF